MILMRLTRHWEEESYCFHSESAATGCTQTSWCRQATCQPSSQPGPAFLRFLPHARRLALQLEPHPYFPQRSRRLQQKLKTLSLFGPDLLLYGHRGAGGIGLPGRSQHWISYQLAWEGSIYLYRYRYLKNKLCICTRFAQFGASGARLQYSPQWMIQNPFNIYHRRSGITQ